MMKTLISHAVIVNEGRSFDGSIMIEGDRIAEIYEGNTAPRDSYDSVVDATGCIVLPGVIDSHVHFREPGLTAKADISSESRAAAYGGVTSFFDMPNTVPQTTTLEALADKFERARTESRVNYSFFFGATNNNFDLFSQLDIHRIPGIKLFMGSSTGNMFVDREESLRRIFSSSPLPLMAHCEDTQIINRNMAEAKATYGDDPAVSFHPLIRSEEACFRSSSLAVSLARTYGAHLHVAHVSTKRELDLFRPGDDKITAEAVIAHLLFSDEDYPRYGTKIKCNPSVKTVADRDALRAALTDGRIATIGTDHAPHLPADKQGGCSRAASGMPMVQFSLVSMLSLVDEGVLSVERLAQLMCHQPATLFGVRDRGFLRPGYKADMVIVRRDMPWTVTADSIQSKCGWSPLEGRTFNWRVLHTFCNGCHIYNQGVFDDGYRGEQILFR